ILKLVMTQPFIKYPGGKRNLLGELKSRLPKKFNRYFEPFVGGGALFFDLEPERAIISDIGSELINMYKVVRDDVDGLIEALSLMKYYPDDLHKSEKYF